MLQISLLRWVLIVIPPLISGISVHDCIRIHPALATSRGGGGGEFTRNKIAIFLRPLLSIFTHKQSLPLLDSLQEQIVHLNRQIRTYQEEIRQLRNLIQQQSYTRNKETSVSIRHYKSQEEQLQQQIHQLQNTITALFVTQSTLEQALKAAQDEMTHLHQHHNQTCGEMQIKAKKELDTLHKTLVQQSKQQLMLVQEELNWKMQVAIEEERKKHKEALEGERNKSKIEVEKEREKMRLLVKALAEKREEKQIDKKKVKEEMTKDKIQTTLSNNASANRKPLSSSGRAPTST